MYFSLTRRLQLVHNQTLTATAAYSGGRVDVPTACTTHLMYIVRFWKLSLVDADASVEVPVKQSASLKDCF